MIKVSVIVPVYNVEKYLKKCLDSLTNQTLKELEIIVVNDGSPDNSQIIIDNFVNRYPKKVKSFIIENGGQGAARNYGLTKAKGEFIAFVDSDDYVEKNMYELLYNKAIQDKSDIVLCGNNIVDLNYNLLKKENVILENNNVDFLREKVAVWNKIYKKSILNDISFRKKVWYEDLDYSLKLVFNRYKISYLNKCLYNYLLR